MTFSDIAGQRLVNQQIAQSTCKTPRDVVARLGAMQAQDFPGAVWSIGLRLPPATTATVHEAVAERTILRTWLMRGTLHFVAAADARWMLELLTPRVVASRVSRHTALGIGPGELARCEKLAVKALRGGKQMARDALIETFARAGIPTANPCGYVILWRLANAGVICFGSHQGKQPAFALLDEWVPGAKSLPREQALAELALRYFTGHGPSTLRDFAWWSGLKTSDARAGLEMVSAKLTHAKVNGTTFWMPPDTPALRDASPTAFLLPGFDEYLLGYTDRDAALDSKHAGKVLGNNGIFQPTMVINGRVAGVWKRDFQKKSVIITPSPFARLKKAEIFALDAPTACYGKFHGMAAVLSRSK